MSADSAIDPSVQSFADASFGGRTAPDGSSIAQNFVSWFGPSAVVASDNAPATFHHGSGNVQGILQRGFAYDLAGIGNDGLGPGWYFTNRPETAKGYAVRRSEPDLVKLGGETSPGVLEVFLSLRNPIRTSHVPGSPWFESLPDLNATQVRAMLLAAPTIRDPDDVLSNWGDVRRHGFEAVLSQASAAYKGTCHFTIFNDFFRGQVQAFLAALHKVTGLDGVMHTFESGEIHAVAWFPHQIKAADNNGLFDARCDDILDARSLRLASDAAAAAFSTKPKEPGRHPSAQRAAKARRVVAAVTSAASVRGGAPAPAL